MGPGSRQELRRESAVPEPAFQGAKFTTSYLNSQVTTRQAHRKSSTAAPVLIVMAVQPGHGIALAAIPLGLLFAGQRTEPRKMLAAGTNFEQLKFESLTFDAVQNSQSREGHRAPVEN